MSRRKSKISVMPADRSLPHHKGNMLIQGLPQTTKAAFKAACAKRGVSMRDVFIEFMRTYAQREEEHGIG